MSVSVSVSVPQGEKRGGMSVSVSVSVPLGEKG